jgi:DNA polymerase-3 subunit alpha
MEKFWTQLEAFAAYCFPKSHAACYAVISYQTAYLKAHYPEAYMSALLTGDYDNIDRLAIEITECQHMGIEVLPPDINESFAEFAVVPGTKQIRFGLPAIKNVGANAVAEILRAREDGSFTDLEDFFRKVNTRTVNHKSLESLIKAGAFDKFGERDFLLHNLDNLLTYASRIQKDILSGQTDLFGSIEDVSTKSQLKLNKAEHLTTKQEKLVWERELLGLYLSEHPLEAYRGFLAKQTTSLSHLSELKHNDIVTVGGVVTVLREITTKNGQKMAFVQLEDELGGAELIFFPQVYQGNIDKVQRDKVLMAKGKFTSQDKEGNLTGDNKILVEAVVEVIPEDVEENGRGPNIEKYLRVSSPVAAKAVPVSPRLFIRLESTGDEKLLMSIKQTIDQHHGSTDVVLVLGPTDNKQIIKLPIKIDTQDKSIEKLKELVGADNIKLS